MRIFLHTFGCKANQYETELMRARMESGGGVSVEDPREADLCLVNSCSVTAVADKECRQFVRRLLRENPRARIVITGCYATHAPKELAALSSRVEVYSNQEKDRLPSCVGFEVGPEIYGLPRYSTRVRAFVKIQDGCRAPCKYCIIPTVRPDLWNKPVDHVLKEVGALINDGHEEVVFTGIRLGLYRDGGLNLAGLLRKIIALPGRFRVRLSSLEVTEASDELVELAASSEKICRHFHIPLQSGEDGVLKEMGRWYRFSQFEERVRFIRGRLPDCGITSDVMVGFPAESEEAFQTTYNRIAGLELSGLHVFPFSPRPGTQAAERTPLPAEAVKDRAKRLINLAKELKMKFHQRFEGTVREVLAEPSGEGWTDNYLRIRFEPGPEIPSGKLIRMRI
ncbi:MAG: tRNA (N(6)-L-threonylcarbamoyladenosine(37)-C(2))-methylthiotransferase MtaB [Elusimicrobia bacterium]|nr:tRNA (N(6)-L-threonylcarbamoyladenosine(37)-C(2))-methylthiotransferase MtaB [Elusimicrobiota bacterium]